LRNGIGYHRAVTPSVQLEPLAPRRKNASIALACVVAAAVAIVSFLPQHEKKALHSHGRFHSWGHLIVFSVVGYLAARAANSRRGRVLFFCMAIIFGTAIEIGEHFAFHSPLERKDILVDALGVVAGTLLASVSARRK
jgi:hypothetical protein